MGVNQLKVPVSAGDTCALVTLAGEAGMNTREMLRDALGGAVTGHGPP